MENVELIKPKKIDSSNEISVDGFVEIINGDTNIKAKNKLVQTILAWFANMTSIHHLFCAGSAYSYQAGTNGWTMYLGTDQITPTAYNTTALTSVINNAPNSTGGSTTNPSNGVFRILFSATWNANTISGTVGEMALYLKVRNTIQGFAWTVTPYADGYYESQYVVSRLAAADGAFTPFAINPGNPLTVNWTMQFSFQ